MQYTRTIDGATVEAVQVSRRNEGDILALGPVRVYEGPEGDDVARIETPVGPITVSAPGYLVKDPDPTKTLFGISLQDFLAEYVPVKAP